MSPRAQYNSSYNTCADARRDDKLVTTKRGFLPFDKCSALPITRRLADQDFLVWYWKPRNTRAGSPVASWARLACCNSPPIALTRRALRARPRTIVHVIGFTPVHDCFATKTRITANHNARLRPMLPDLTHNPCQFVDTARRRINVRWSQART